MANQNSVSAVWVLALGGFIPFVVLAIAAVAGSSLFAGISALNAFLVWSLVILSFLGGIRWGLAMQNHIPDTTVITLSVVPCIIGWFSLAIPALWTVIVLIALYVFHGFWDVRSLRGEPQSWFAPIRMTLTVLVCAVHFLVLVSLL